MLTSQTVFQIEFIEIVTAHHYTDGNIFLIKIKSQNVKLKLCQRSCHAVKKHNHKLIIDKIK